MSIEICGLFFIIIGGGCLLLRASKLLHLDGLISASGLSGASNSGGGSGGSILIKTMNMTGHGEISVNGGEGPQYYSGGGSGGRIAVHVDFQNNYGGLFFCCLVHCFGYRHSFSSKKERNLNVVCLCVM